MSAAIGWSLVLGAVLGLGLWSIASLVPVLRRPRLSERLVPYILDVSPEARTVLARRSTDPLPIVGSLLAPSVGWIGRALGSALGRGESVAIRLDQARSPLTVEQFRLEQVVSGVGGIAAALALIAVVPSVAAMPAPALVALPLLGAMVGVAVRDRLLSRRATRRVSRIVGELPTVLEFLTLSLSAGEGIHDALRRVAAVSSGELAGEFGRVLTDVGLGDSLSAALDRMDARLASPAVSRFVEQTTGALERGTPLAEVLRAQADDARNAARRALLDSAGRKEVGMMIPLVFGILPTTICFAVFPGFVVLQTGF